MLGRLRLCVWVYVCVWHRLKEGADVHVYMYAQLATA